MRPIQYIGGNNNNDYMLTNGSGVNSVPYTQTLAENGTIETVTISSLIDLSEPSAPRIYSDDTSGSAHPYMTTGTNGLIPYVVQGTTVVANNMPKRLAGWRAKNNNTNLYEDFDYTTLTATEISRYAVNNEIALYGNWVNISLIRVIVFIPYDDEIWGSPVKYDVTLTANTSYIPSHIPYYNLTTNFQNIVDYTNPSLKKLTGAYYQYEYGEGSGCPITISNTLYPKYFGVKNSDFCNIEICHKTGVWIPIYTFETVGEGDNLSITPVYHYYITNALRCDINGYEKDSTMLDFSYSSPYTNANNEKCWSTDISFTPNTGDVTVLIPLTKKPIISTFVTPNISGYYAYIGGDTNVAPENQITSTTIMPGESCTVTTYTSIHGSTFDGWFLNGPHGTFLSNSQTYTYTLDSARSITKLYAKYSPLVPPQVLNPIVYVSYYLLFPQGYSDTGFASNQPEQPKYSLDGGTTWTQLNNTNEVSFSVTTSQQVILRVPTNGKGNVSSGNYDFNGFLQYDDTRIPQNDISRKLILNGTFPEGGYYSVTPASVNEIQITLANLSTDTTYKIYALYSLYNEPQY